MAPANIDDLDRVTLSFTLAVSKFFLTLTYQSMWHVLTTLCVYMDGKVSTVFNRDCFFFKNERLFKVRRPRQAVMHRITGRIKEMAHSQKFCYYIPLIGSIIAYLFVPFPMTFENLEGHSPNAWLTKCNSTNVCATFSTVLTDTARRAVPRR